jgi:hypothetical protein
MSSHSFFHLTPPTVSDDSCTCDHEILSPDEDAAQEALYSGLIETLYAALNTYCEAHEAITYGTCIIAANCLAALLTKEHDEEHCDA